MCGTGTNVDIFLLLLNFYKHLDPYDLHTKYEPYSF